LNILFPALLLCQASENMGPNRKAWIKNYEAWFKNREARSDFGPLCTPPHAPFRKSEKTPFRGLAASSF
jgi:hypothetical protein